MKTWQKSLAGYAGAGAVVLLGLAGCMTPPMAREQADEAAERIIREVRGKVVGNESTIAVEPASETFRRRLIEAQGLLVSSGASKGSGGVEAIKEFPEKEYLTHEKAARGFVPAVEGNEPVRLSLVDALRVAAANSAEYQGQKETVFQAALALDLTAQQFRLTWSGVVEDEVSTDLAADPQQPANEVSGRIGLTQRLKNGLTLSGALSLNLVQLLTGSEASSRGIMGDASVTLPLMRGSGEFIVTEPLTQAERDVMYAIYRFERYKRSFAVRITSDYLSVLQQGDSVQTAEDNYKRQVISARRAARHEEAGKMTPVQADQARQAELRARASWISTQMTFGRRMDSFKQTLGLPVDAKIVLSRDELGMMTEQVKLHIKDLEGGLPRDGGGSADAPVVLAPPDMKNVGPYEYEEEAAVRGALEKRLDLRVAIGQVFDAQRSAVVAADQLKADVTLFGRGTAGSLRGAASAESEDAALRLDQARYAGGITIDLGLERTSERNRYRSSLIGLEAAVRRLQTTEDQVKLEVRNGLRKLVEQRESVRIQSRALELAQRRVDSTNLFLEAGRAQIRDLLDAQDSLVTARNALTSATVNYRIAELEIQRDMELLVVSDQGVMTEHEEDAGKQEQEGG